jgi:hypothetical protein
MQITHYLASENYPIHTSHFHPCSLQCVHLLRTSCEQTKHSVKTFHQNCEFLLPRVLLPVSFTQKRGTHFKETQYSLEWAKKFQSRYGWVMHLPGRHVSQPEKYMIPLQNHYMDLESKEYHNTCKGKVSKMYMTWTDLVLLHSDLHKIRVSKDY